MRNNNILRRTTALAGGVCIIGFLAAAPAAAADGTSGDVEVVNTETVQTYMTADGDIDTKRVYEQLALTGKGSVDLTNPIATSGVRNLDGFTDVEVEDGEQLVNTEVDGEEKLRSVSDFKGDLPLAIDVNYELDGRTVEPGDLVGKSGKLAVTFNVENVTGKMQAIEVPDGKGGTITKTVEVPIPMVGSLSTVAPENFNNVASEQANLAGDGQGGTKVSFTMTLFPPVGSNSATFGYTADVRDGVVPRIEVSALPINPLESPTFASAAESYQGGADTGAKLTDGAVEIDANLLRLRDGAAELLAGLIKLRDGSGELSAGLNDTAVPGSAKLADGAEELSLGLLKLDDGAGKLSDGSRRLAAGTGDAYAGGKKLTDGLKQISGGLGQLSGQLPGASEGIKKLQDGVDKLIAGMGTPGNPTTLIGGLVKLSNGLGDLQTGAGQVKGGLQQLTAPTGLPAAKGGVDQVRNGLYDSLAPGGSLAQLQGGLGAVKTNFCPGHTTPAVDTACANTLDQLLAGAAQSRRDLRIAAAGLGQVSDGLANAIGSLDTLLIPGMTKILNGLADAKTGVDGKLIPGAKAIKGGLGEVRGGLDELALGITKAVSGVGQLDEGAASAYSGSGELTDGLGKLDDGAGELSDGAGRLADGTGKASDGGSQVADGAGQLADGLKDAGDGSTKLFEGLVTAANAAPALPEGAQRLSDEGTKKLIAAGESTTSEYGELVSVIKAGAERGSAEKMAFGAPEDAVGLTAYSYIIQGEDGESGRNLTRALGGLAVFGAAGGMFLLRRRGVI